ncbi:MAG: MFS transporter [Patescibacteria group bacterium]
MFRHWHIHRPHYFSKHLSKQIEELYVSVAIMDFALAAMGFFAPIYLYNIGYPLWQIMLFYLSGYLLYFFLIPFGGQYVGRYGYEKSMMIASLALAGHYLLLFIIPSWPAAFWLAVLLFAVQKMFFWPAYHADFGKYSYRNDRGSQVSGLVALDQTVFIFGPLIGGIIIKFLGFPVLFGVAILLILLSNVPIFMTTEKIKQIRFAYKDSLAYLTDKKRRSQLVAYLGFGEEIVSWIVWPIFIFLIVKDYFSIGFIVAGASLITVLITLYVGKLFDRGQKNKMIGFSTILYSLSGLGRIFTGSSGGVFVFDSMQKFFKNGLYVPILAGLYEKTKPGKDLLLQGIFYEQALSLGKIFVALLIMLIALFTDGYLAAFVIGAGVSLLYLFILRTEQ